MITFTSGAAKKVISLIEGQQKEGLALRMFVSDGGCTGLEYGMTLDDSQHPDDLAVDAEGFRILVDPGSAVYLEGAEVDYVESVMRSGFTINNPNATRTCACGRSFRTADEKGHAHSCT
ncbi:MAG: iron-sulfur cluster assembly accessory protein [Chloroflexi bacterium]|nr:iron-sulfur cluster assembly accessory protein [Chloroflexota bacterium]